MTEGRELPGLARLRARLRADPAAAPGMVVLAGCAVFALAVLLPAEIRHRELVAAVAEGGRPLPAAPRVAGIERLPAVLVGLHALAEGGDAGDAVEAGRVLLQEEHAGEERRVAVTLPLAGGYPAIRRLVAGALRLAPGSVLTGITLQRNSTDEGRLTGQVQLLFRFAAGAMAAAPPPAVGTPTATAAAPDLFAVRRIAEAAVAPVAPAASEAPVVPPLPYRYVGRILADGAPPAYLLDTGGAILVARPGQRVGDEHRFLGYRAGQLEFRHRSSAVTQTLAVGELR